MSVLRKTFGAAYLCLYNFIPHVLAQPGHVHFVYDDVEHHFYMPKPVESTDNTVAEQIVAAICSSTNVRSCREVASTIIESSQHKDFFQKQNWFSEFNVTINSKDNLKTATVNVGRGTYGFPSDIVWWGLADYKDVVPLSIGRYCSLAGNITIFLDGNHCYHRISTFPWHVRGRRIFNHRIDNDLYSLRIKDDFMEPTCKESVELRPVRIGSDIWIGASVTIFFGVTIGDGAVIGAHSVVRKDVEPYSIVIGNPAVHVKYRFDNETIHEFLQIQWWNWSEDEIDDAMDYFLSDEGPQAFIDYAKKRNVHGTSVMD